MRKLLDIFLTEADDSQSKAAPKVVALLHGRISFFFAAPALEQTTLCLSPPAFQSVKLNKEESEQGEIEDYYWTGSVWHGGEAGITSSAESLIRTEKPIHSRRRMNQTTLGQYFPFLFPLLLLSEKRKLLLLFFLPLPVLSDHRQIHLQPQRHNYLSFLFHLIPLLHLLLKLQTLHRQVNLCWRPTNPCLPLLRTRNFSLH